MQLHFINTINLFKSSLVIIAETEELTMIFNLSFFAISAIFLNQYPLDCHVNIFSNVYFDQQYLII